MKTVGALEPLLSAKSPEPYLEEISL